MIISYPVSQSRIIVLLKTLRHRVESEEKKLKKGTLLQRKPKEKNHFSIKRNKQKGHKKTFIVLQRFWSKLNERKGLAFEKSAEFIRSELL